MTKSSEKEGETGVEYPGYTFKEHQITLGKQ
jgi:hypothetical protein